VLDSGFTALFLLDIAAAFHLGCVVNELARSSIIFLLFLEFFGWIYESAKDKCYLDDWRKVIQDCVVALSMPI
jgi:hypothetical protein